MYKIISPLEKQLLLEQLKEYLVYGTPSAFEYKSLKLWIKSGHPVNSNP